MPTGSPFDSYNGLPIDTGVGSAPGLAIDTGTDFGAMPTDSEIVRRLIAEGTGAAPNELPSGTVPVSSGAARRPGAVDPERQGFLRTLGVIADVMAGLGGRQGTATASVLAGQREARLAAAEERRAEIEARRLVLSELAEARQWQSAQITDWKNLIAAPAEFLKNNPTTTEETRRAFLDDLERQARASGVRTPRSLYAGMLEHPNIAEIAAEFSPWIGTGDQAKRNEVIIRSMMQDQDQRRQIPAFIAQNAAPFVVDELRLAKSGIVQAIRSLPEYADPAKPIPFDAYVNVVRSIPDKGRGMARVLLGTDFPEERRSLLWDVVIPAGVERPDIAGKAAQAGATEAAQIAARTAPEAIKSEAARATALELAQNAPEVAAAKAAAAAKVEEAKKQVEARFRGTGPLTPDEVASVRREFMGATKDFRDILNSYKRLEAVATTPSAAGDLAMIFSYMKMLDPESVVRETEQANAVNARGVPEAIRTVYNRVASGERLGPDQRQDFLTKARELVKGSLEAHEQLESEYQRIAKGRKADPKEVVPDVVGTDLRKKIRTFTPGSASPDAQAAADAYLKKKRR